MHLLVTWYKIKLDSVAENRRIICFQEATGMGFFDNFKEKATGLAQAGVAQSKRLGEIAKLKTANLGEEDAIKKAYIEIGKLYYEANCAAPGEEYAAACEKITAAKAAIEANNERIAQLKEEGDEDEVEVVEVVEDVAVKAEEVVEEIVEEVKETVEEVKEAITEE